VPAYPPDAEDRDSACRARSRRNGYFARARSVHHVAARTLRLVLLGAVLSAVATPAVAREADGWPANYIMVGCRAIYATSAIDTTLIRSGVCLGVVRTWMIVLNETGAICRPQQVTLDQAVRVVVAYIDGRPAQLHEPFDILAAEAMRSAWPCRQRR